MVEGLELMKASAEKKAKEYPIKMEQWLKGRPAAARWSDATDVLLSQLWTGQAVLWRLSTEGILSRLDPKTLLLKNDLQHRLRTADGYNPSCPTLPWQPEASPKYFDTLLVSGLELSLEGAADPATVPRRPAKAGRAQAVAKQQAAGIKAGARPKVDWDALVPDMEAIWRKNKDWTFQEAIEEIRLLHKRLENVDDSIIEKRLRFVRRSLSE
jgi:hypothetical protein